MNRICSSLLPTSNPAYFSPSVDTKKVGDDLPFCVGSCEIQSQCWSSTKSPRSDSLSNGGAKRCHDMANHHNSPSIVSETSL